MSSKNRFRGSSLHRRSFPDFGRGGRFLRIFVFLVFASVGAIFTAPLWVPIVMPGCNVQAVPVEITVPKYMASDYLLDDDNHWEVVEEVGDSVILRTWNNEIICEGQ